jgi:formate C-acetyltransferase
MDLGIFQMQINMVGSDQLREAQKDPENNADLLVRIGGYLVPFTQLPKDAQQDVIARTEMEV